MSTTTRFFDQKRFRKEYGKFPPRIEIPDLIEVQKKSYEKFLQSEAVSGTREITGLQGVFKSVFPIHDFNNTASLEFESYTLETPKYDVDECRSRGMSFAAPLKVTVRLEVYDVDEQTQTRSIKDVKEQEVYLGEIPLMTDRGSFIINGTERVVVSQLHRSPGVFFDHDKGASHSSGKLLYSARIIPYRGSWLDFEFDHKDILYVRIDRRRKLHVTVLLKALGYTVEELLSYFYDHETVTIGKGGKLLLNFEPKLYAGQRANYDWKDEDGKVVVEKNKKFTQSLIKKIEEQKIKRFPIEREHLIGKFCAVDVVDLETGEVLLECNEEVTDEKLDLLADRKIADFKILYTDRINVGTYLRDTLVQDKISTKEEALIEIYRRLRPGDPPTLETAQVLFDGLFFDPTKYELSRVGRLKINHKFGFTTPLDFTTLTKEDILAVVRYLVDLKNGKGQIDDIDHLGNRRVRAVGELLENQFRIGLVRMERAIRERMSLQDVETLMPHDLINAKPVSAVVKEFFGSSQLSQFMDQTNPLSEVTHKRRLSALGPGGLTRERAGFEVRDVHATHYGRICPIETPEGPNIGLISSLSTFGRVNDYGFIETPYRKIVNGKISDEVVFYSALEEENHTIAQATIATKDGKVAVEYVPARRQGETILARGEDVDLLDVSPNQLVSIAASLIPFLENDDANRALMGSNMQRQAVPLVRAEAPLVGTGMEYRAAVDSGDVVVAEKAGVITEVSADLVTVAGDDGTTRTYRINKFNRSNQGNSYNQRVIVSEGDRVEAGGLIADGPATDGGEMALGRNLLVAFMPWEGHNYEDAIILSQRLVQDDVLSSIHIEEHEVDARDTKLGPEEITRDIPNVSEEVLADLDERGIIRIGAEVRDGDLLVGKVTPKGETELTPEERLLRAIFGEKAREVRDTSLKVPHGETGTVIGVKVFDKDEGDELPPGVNQLVRVYVANKRKITDGDKLAGRHGNKGVISKILPVEDMPFLEDGTPVDVVLNPLGVPGRMNVGQILELHLGWAASRGWTIEGDPEWARLIPDDARSAPAGTRVASPVFDGVREDEIIGLLDSTTKTRDDVRLIDGSGKARLFDGRSGEPFPEPVSVGYMYILKLHHLVDDKIHARSTGPYSMITQQPLGGKAQFGGQRFGEMEVWALEAYGAAYALQELLTIKSDDVNGRVKVYEAIVKGDNIPEPGIPESFKVLIKEMQSLCLNVEVLSSDGTTIEMHEAEEDVFRAAEELGIDLSRREPSSVEEV